MSYHSYILEISLSNVFFTDRNVEGYMTIGQAKDHWMLSQNSLSISIERRKALNPDTDCFIPTRVKRIQNLFIILYGVFGEIPSIKNAVLYDLNKSTLQSVSLPDAFKVYEKYNCKPFLTFDDFAEISISDSRKIATTCISYIMGSHASINQNERFRFLWSAFNVLYRKAFQNLSPEWKRPKSLLIEMVKNNELNDEQVRVSNFNFDSTFWNFSHFLSGFSALKHQKDKSISSLAPKALSYADEVMLEALLKSDNKRRNSYIENNNPLKESLASIEERETSNLIFLFGIYFYWLRCDSMHAEHRYEIFQSKDYLATASMVYDTFEKVVVKALLHVVNS